MPPHGPLSARRTMDMTAGVSATCSSISGGRKQSSQRSVSDQQARVQARRPRRLRSAANRIHRLVHASIGLLDSLKGKWVCGQKSSRKNRRPPCRKGTENQSRIQKLDSQIENETEKQELDLYDTRMDLGALKTMSWGSSCDRVKDRSLQSFKSGMEYELEDLKVGGLLGKGAHGSVHLGRLSGETVAVKQAYGMCANRTWGSGSASSPELEFMDEMYHPNLVEIYGVHMVEKPWDGDLSSPFSDNSSGSGWEESLWDVDGSESFSQTIVVMEYCDGGSLWDAVRSGVLSVGRVPGVPNYVMIVQVAMDIVLAMEHLHERGIIHGDLTAKNVLLSSTEAGKKFVAKVGDYGLCRRLQQTRDEINTFTFGSVDHMAPETLQHGKLHKPTDVFSFGVLLFELITGRHPFLNMTQAAVIVAIVEGMRPKIPSTCPADLASLIRMCWHQKWWCRPSFGNIWNRLIYATT